MIVWPAKDPAEVLDFTWTVPLDADDTIATAAITLLSGTVVIDEDDNTDTQLQAWLSAGADGETATFNLTATTAGGRTFREVAILPVFDRASELLALFRLRYSAFATTDDGTIGYWLADAAVAVDDSWPELRRDPAKLALAAHMLAANSSEIPAGVTSFKSGTFSATFADAAANRTGLEATIYGREFLSLRRLSFAGPRLAWDPPASVR